MTKEEKIQQHLDNISREEKIERMSEHVYESYDRDILVDMALNSMGLDDLSNSELSDEYYDWFGYEIDDFDDDDDDDEVVDAEFVEPMKPKCTCGGFGTHSDWCDLITGEFTMEVY